MVLARGVSDDPEAWLWALGAIALYALISFGLEYRSRRRRGAHDPAREALHELKDREDPQSPGQYFVSRMIMLGGAAATGLVAWAASGVVRPVAVAFTALVAVVAWAYYDHRAQGRAARR
ncbi:hypothetical protein [Streptomyces poonensis]|uniref:hypothetical protein n=1 Tax=Streptomyces poonensis TaxID=68255 RepID=UPI00167253D6|nr:hypothetical protein [Streptomyces poonensis]GLJ92139.1 hypothetical protein GCM10017589_47480 [Streptomyces poonensis]